MNFSMLGFTSCKMLKIHVSRSKGCCEGGKPSILNPCVSKTGVSKLASPFYPGFLVRWAQGPSPLAHRVAFGWCLSASCDSSLFWLPFLFLVSSSPASLVLTKCHDLQLLLSPMTSLPRVRGDRWALFWRILLFLIWPIEGAWGQHLKGFSIT